MARLLLVDDEPDILSGIAEIMELNGYTVETARNGAEALKIMDAGFRPNLILLDLMMPVMDGETFYRRLQERPAYRRIPVLGFSAFSHIRPPFPVVQKAGKTEDLIAMVNGMARGHRAMRILKYTAAILVAGAGLVKALLEWAKQKGRP